MGSMTFDQNGGGHPGSGNKTTNAAEIETLLKTNFAESIKGLRVSFEAGKVTLAGKCDSRATQERAIRIVSDLKGVTEVNFEELYGPKAGGVTESYTIQKGDTLWKIAKTYYGDGARYPEIFEANKDVLKDPNLIFPGQQIKIPNVK